MHLEGESLRRKTALFLWTPFQILIEILMSPQYDLKKKSNCPLCFEDLQ